MRICNARKGAQYFMHKKKYKEHKASSIERVKCETAFDYCAKNPRMGS
jgi:hypothetical protein